MDSDLPESKSYEDDFLSNSSSFIEGRSSSVVILPFQLATDRTQFKTAKVCSSCGVTFGKVLNLIHAKKYYCKFCYTGVCQNCSKQKLMHPESRKQERCCGKCYGKFVADSIRADMEVDIQRRASVADDLMRQYHQEQSAEQEEAETTKVLADDLKRLKDELERQRLEAEVEMKKRREKEEELKTEIQTITNENEKIDRDIAAIYEEIDKMKSQMQNIGKDEKTDDSKYQEIVRLQEETEEDIKKITEQLKSEPVPSQVIEEPTKNSKTLELQHALETDREQLIHLQQDNLNLTQQLSDLKTEFAAIEKSRNKLISQKKQEQEMTKVADGVRSGSDQYDTRELERRVICLEYEADRLRLNISQSKASSSQSSEDSEISDLRTDISKEKERNKLLMLSFQEKLLAERRPESLNEDQCRCHCQMF